MTGGVENWLFFAPTSTAPTSITAMEKWIGQYGGGTFLNVTSPYVISGLANGVSYSFSLNGRTNGGPGGPGSTPVTATPRIAGASWTAGTAISGGNDLRAVAFGVSTAATTTTAAVTRYVAAGSSGAMYSSLDGASWSAINYSNTSRINGAAYFGNYKLVGDGGLVLTSSDALAWTAPTTNTTQNLYAIASNYANLNVAVGANGTIISSPDGVTWTTASSTGTSSDLYAVTYTSYNSGTWVAVGAAGAMVASSDGLTWHSVSSGTTADLRGVAYAAMVSTSGVITTTFVAVGAAGTVLSSADATAWTAQVLPVAGTNLNAVIFGTQFVAAGAGGNVFVSTDGAAWTAASSATSNEIFALTHGLNAYSAVGAAGTNLLSK
jgi:hypothetical protein